MAALVSVANNNNNNNNHNSPLRSLSSSKNSKSAETTSTASAAAAAAAVEASSTPSALPSFFQFKDEDFCSADEVKVYRDEGEDEGKDEDEDDQKDSISKRGMVIEELLEEKALLIQETELGIKQETILRLEAAAGQLSAIRKSIIQMNFRWPYESQK